MENHNLSLENSLFLWWFSHQLCKRLPEGILVYFVFGYPRGCVSLKKVLDHVGSRHLSSAQLRICVLLNVMGIYGAFGKDTKTWWGVGKKYRGFPWISWSKPWEKGREILHGFPFLEIIFWDLVKGWWIFCLLFGRDLWGLDPQTERKILKQKREISVFKYDWKDIMYIYIYIY